MKSLIRHDSTKMEWNTERIIKEMVLKCTFYCTVIPRVRKLFTPLNTRVNSCLRRISSRCLSWLPVEPNISENLIQLFMTIKGLGRCFTLYWLGLSVNIYLEQPLTQFLCFPPHDQTSFTWPLWPQFLLWWVYLCHLIELRAKVISVFLM